MDPHTDRHKHTIFHCPKTFSFIEDPDEALRAAYRFAKAVLRRSETISVGQRDVSQVDLCAASVLNALALEAHSRFKVSLEGMLPLNKDAREITMATGLPNVLRVPMPEPEGFLKYGLQRGTAVGATGHSSSRDAVEAEKFTDYIDSCLAVNGHHLTHQGRDYLAQLVGEVLSNAEEHSGLGEWWIAGYLRQRPGEGQGDCHITIFSFGETLEETLQSLPSDALLRQHIEKLVTKHTSRRGFSSITGRLTPENLWTIYALQEGVSRFNVQRETEILGTRGVGTVRMIEMFQRLGQSSRPDCEPVMCLQSGKTNLRFDNSVQMASLNPESGTPGRRIIAFNRNNDLAEPPEARYVRTTAMPFPGVLISLRFFLDRQYLQEITSSYAVLH